MIAIDEDAKCLREIQRVAAARFDVLITRDPKQALSAAETEPDLALFLAEQDLSTTTGITLLEMIRTMRPKASRVLATRSADLAAIVQGLHSGVIQRMLYKPFTPAELAAAVLSAAATARATG